MENKPLEQMTDDELLQLHAQEFGLESLSDDQLKRLTDIHANEPQVEERGAFSVTPSGLGHAFVESLPAAGGIIGGGLGGLGTYGLGTVPMAALGAGAGKALQTGLEHVFYDKPVSRAELYGGPIAEAATGAASEMAAPLVGMAAKGLGNVVTKSAKSVSSSLSKIPEKVMETYAARPQAVEDMNVNVGLDDVALAEEANKYRAQIQKYIENFKSVQNAKITKSIEQIGVDKLVDINKTIKALQDNINKIDPVLNPEKVAPLIKELETIKFMSNAEGQVTARQAYDIGNKLQELADYKKMQNPFAKKDFVDITFAKGAAESRQALKKVVPGVSEANAELAKIRRMNATINKNLITPDKPFQSLMGVGTGENQMNILQMKKLGDVLGKNLLSVPEEMAAASYFNKAGLLPREKTGSAMAPLILSGIGGGGGAVKGYFDASGGDEGDKIASTLGGLGKGLLLGSLASPIMIKQAIKASRMGTDLAGKMIPPNTGNAMEKLIQFGIQNGVSPIMQYNTIKNMEGLTNTEKAQFYKQLGKGQ